MFYGMPAVKDGFKPITSRAGDLNLIVSQYTPFPEDYVNQPDESGDPVSVPLDLANIPIGWDDEQSLEGPLSELSAYTGTPKQFVPTIWYSPAFITDSDPNTLTDERKQFLIDALLWEFTNFVREGTAVIAGHSGITWQSGNFGLFYSAESARTDPSTLDPDTYPAGISQFAPGAPQAYTLVLYYDEISETGHTPEDPLDFDPDPPAEEPDPIFTILEDSPILPDVCDIGMKPKTYQFDLRKLDIGFNASSINPIQEHIIHGLETDRYLLSETEIVRDDLFFESLQGSAGTFWYPSPFEEVNITAAISGTQFKVTDRSFTEQFDDQPAKYLEIRRKADSTVHISKITTVSDNGDGTETITLTTSASPGVAVGDAARVLHRVRLAGNEERITYIDEQICKRNIKMIEVPYEYGSTVAVKSKVYLYRFSCNGVHWHYTSFEQSIGSTFNASFDLANFAPAPINHGSIKKSAKADREETQITAVFGSVTPLGYWAPFTLSQPMFVEIFETDSVTPTTGTSLFYGRVQSVQVEGRKLVAKCASILDSLSDRVPRFIIGPRCNHHLFSPGCGLNRASYADTVEVDSISGVQVVVSAVANNTAGYFAFGWAEALTGADKEVRSILKSTASGGGVHTLWLNLPFKRVTTADQLVIYPGCDGLLATCNSKFTNTDNFGGHPFVPPNNLTLKALTIPSSGGGKK